MSPTVRPRGPLPARVYWTRRLVVLAVPLVLVVTAAKVLGGPSDGDEGATATRASARTTPPPAAAAETLGPSVPEPAKAKRKKQQPPPEPVLAEPTGPCANDDIVATPAVTEAPGGRDAAITLNLRTLETEACTWQTSAQTLTVTITSGKDDIWSSRECPAAIPVQDVVVRREVDAPVTFTWNRRRSDETCSPNTDGALPGFYHVQAAALGGEPTDVQFELVRPTPPPVAQSPKARSGEKDRKDRTKDRAHTPGEDGVGNSEG